MGRNRIFNLSEISKMYEKCASMIASLEFSYIHRVVAVYKNIYYVLYI
jgi:hypothetical protein